MSHDTLTYRQAVPEDSAGCVELRGKTRENAITPSRLESLGITSASWADGIRTGDRPGYVCLNQETLLGYCFGDKQTGEVIVLALLPEHEARGIGKRLLSLVVQDLRQLGHTRLFLGSPADPTTRAHGFYRHLGWQPTGTVDHAGDVVLEYFITGDNRIEGTERP
jgi:GNAT superfamily N-acetyltransferase